MLPTPIGLALSLLLAPACAAADGNEVMQSGTTSAEIVKVQANQHRVICPRTTVCAIS